MKNKAINTLGYSGIVKLSQNIGSKKIEVAKFYNAGGHSLFNFFSDCLIGDFAVANLNRPSQILLLHKAKDDTYRRLSGFITHTSQPEKVYTSDRSISSVRYSFTIHRDLLDSIDLSELNYIGLYAKSANINNPEDFAALVSVGNLNDKNVSETSAILLDWELNISNK